MSTHRTYVALRPDQVRALDALHERAGMSQAEAIRRALDRFLKIRPPKSTSPGGERE